MLRIFLQLSQKNEQLSSMPVAVFAFQLTGPGALANVQFSAAKVKGVRPSFGGTLGVIGEVRTYVLRVRLFSNGFDKV